MKKIDLGGIKVNQDLYEFVNNEVIPGTDIDPESFWQKFEKSVEHLAPINK